MWLWIGVGLGAFFFLSVLLGLALGAILGAISRGVTEMHEGDAWATKPPTRATAEAEERELEERAIRNGDPGKTTSG